jgi:hypothetical protein
MLLWLKTSVIDHDIVLRRGEYGPLVGSQESISRLLSSSGIKNTASLNFYFPLCLHHHSLSSKFVSVTVNKLFFSSHLWDIKIHVKTYIEILLNFIRVSFWRFLSGLIFILLYFILLGWGGTDWTNLAQNRDQWRALLNTEMNLCVP